VKHVSFDKAKTPASRKPEPLWMSPAGHGRQRAVLDTAPVISLFTPPYLLTLFH
jgi:hypothetical protein